MKISVCDVCKYQSNKLVETRYRIGYKQGLKIDSCEEHKNFFTNVPYPIGMEKYLTLVKGDIK